MKAGTPFRAACIAFAAIAAALKIAAPLERRMALAAITPYSGRGKGRGSPSRNWLRPYCNNAGRGRPHQGNSEILRRSRHISLGILRAENGLAVA